MFYDITKIKDTSIARAAGTANDGSSSASNRDVFNNNISQTDGNVNPSDKSNLRTSKDDNKRYSLDVNARREIIEKMESVRFSRRRKRYITRSIDSDTLDDIHRQLKKLYGDVRNDIANSVALEVEKTIYLVDSGIDGGKIDIGVYHQITILDDGR